VRQYIVQLRGVLAYAKPGWGLEDVTDAPIREAYPLLKKQGLIGISKRRKQSPTQEQINELTAYWVAHAHTTRIPMYDIVPFQYDSTRRIVETVGLMWGDLNEKYKTILVRNMKHNRGKPADKEVAIPDPAFEIIMRQPRRTTDPTERIFPYTKAAIQWQWPIGLGACGLRGLLHLHDLRRGGTTKLLKAGVPPNKVILVTGHDTFDMVMTTYNAMTARDFHAR
jgi:integrase